MKKRVKILILNNFYFRKSLDGSQHCLRSGDGFSVELATRRVHLCYSYSLFCFGDTRCISSDVFLWRGMFFDGLITFSFTGIFWCGSRKLKQVANKISRSTQLKWTFLKAYHATYLKSLADWKFQFSSKILFWILIYRAAGWLLIAEILATFQSTPTPIIKRSSKFLISINGRRGLVNKFCRDCVTAADACVL